MSKSHLDDAQIALYALGELEYEDARIVLAHMEECPECAARVVDELDFERDVMLAAMLVGNRQQLGKPAVARPPWRQFLAAFQEKVGRGGFAMAAVVLLAVVGGFMVVTHQRVVNYQLELEGGRMQMMGKPEVSSHFSVGSTVHLRLSPLERAAESPPTVMVFVGDQNLTEIWVEEDVSPWGVIELSHKITEGSPLSKPGTYVVWVATGYGMAPSEEERRKMVEEGHLSGWRSYRQLLVVE